MNAANRTSGQKQWARADEMEAQRVRAPKPTKTLPTEGLATETA